MEPVGDIFYVSGSPFPFQIFAAAYGSDVDIDDMEDTITVINQAMECISEVHPELMQKQKFHMLLHLPSDMLNYGPPVGFCTERCLLYGSLYKIRS